MSVEILKAIVCLTMLACFIYTVKGLLSKLFVKMFASGLANALTVVPVNENDSIEYISMCIKLAGIKKAVVIDNGMSEEEKNICKHLENIDVISSKTELYEKIVYDK